MKKIISVSTIFLLLGLSCVFIGCGQKAQPENLIAQFDDQAITLNEFEKEVSELSDREKRKYEGKEGLEEYLTLMAESRMLLTVANESGLNKDADIVKQINDYRDQLIVKELVKREVDDKVIVSDGDVQKYYEEHKEEYIDPEKVVVTEITLTDEEKAKEIMEMVKGGADFTELAKEMDAKGESSGPGMGSEGKTNPFSRESFRGVQEFVDTTFALEVNQMSDIIVQQMGEKTYYMIVRLDERIPPRQKELSEVEKKINRIVQREKKKEQMDRWLQIIKTEKQFQIYPEKLPEPAAEEAEAEVEAEAGEVEAGETVEKAEETTEQQKAPGEAVEEKK